MIQWHILLLSLLLCVLGSSAAIGQDDNGSRGDIVFIENRGQVVDAGGNTRPDILFTAEAAGMKLYCRNSGISYVLHRTEQTLQPPLLQPVVADLLRMNAIQPTNRASDDRHTTLCRLDVEFSGALLGNAVGQEQIGGRFNYYYTHCADGIADVRGYRRVVYRNVYPDIDLVLYTKKGGLKYDFVVHPGGDPRRICLKYRGAEKLVHKADGALQIQTPLGSIDEQKPYSYQGGKEIASAYRVEGGSVSFELGDYDTTQPLVIDPDVLWSTYYGGSSEDWGYDVDTDASGNVLVAGYTFSIDFPLHNALQSVIKDDYDDAFVLKMSPDGERIWATYYGGSRDDIAVGIAADATGGIAVVGRTGSPDFPTQNAWQSSLGGSFVLKLSPDGQRLWATCIGGMHDIANGVAADRSGGVIVLGETWSDTFPTFNAFQPALGGMTDAFIAHFSSSGSLLWSTYLGGSGSESYIAPWGCDAVAVDNSNTIIVGGTTTSDDFPLRNPLQATRMGETDCFIIRLSISGVPLWSTYYGGQSYEYTYSVATDRKNNILICGATSSSDFPVVQAFQTSLMGTQDAFILKLSPQGEWLWSTYYGGSANEEAYGVAADGRDNVFLTGWTESSNFPVFDPFQAVSGGGSDAFVVGFDEHGGRIWSTYFGGDDRIWFEKGHGIATDNESRIVVVGATGSANIPMINAIQPIKSGSSDAFIVRFSCAAPRPETTPTGAIRICEGDSAIISAAPGYNSYLWSNGATTASIVVRKAGVYSVLTDASAPCNTASRPVTVDIVPRPMPEVIGPVALCEGARAFLRADTPYREYHWMFDTSVIATAQQVEISSAGVYTLTVTNDQGCTGSTTIAVASRPRPTTQIVAAPSATLCPGGSIILTAVGVFPAYAWSNGATTPSITVREAGTYAVFVTDENGCTSLTVSQKVDMADVPSSGIVGSLSVCAGNEAVYVVPKQAGMLYRWTATGGSIVSSATDERVRIRWTQSGAGSVVLTRTVQQCQSTTTLAVSVADSLQPDVIGVTELCPGFTTELRVAGVYAEYRWTGGATSSSIVVDTPGAYTVTVHNDQGCSGSTTITIVAGAVPQFMILGSARVCTNSTTVYTASDVSAAANFDWNVEGGAILSGRSTPAITVQWGAGTTGSVAVKVRHQNSLCEGETAMVVAIGGVLQPMVMAVPAVPCQGESVVLSAGSGFSSYLWSTGETTESITVSDDGEYSVVVSDGSGCAGSTTAVVIYRGTTFGLAGYIDWGAVVVGSTTQEVRTWVNRSAETVRVESWHFAPNLPEFAAAFIPPLPADIPPGDSLVVAVQFHPQQAGVYKSDLLVDILNPCPETLSFSISAMGTGTVVVASFPDTTALPWQRGYRMPLMAQITLGNEPGGHTVEFTATMDASVFFPTGLSRGVITGSAVDATTGERRVSGRIEHVELANQPSIATELIGDILLGERDNTVFTVEAFTLTDVPFSTSEKRQGVLTLEGICREGDTRFVRSKSGFGISIQPHPVQEELVVLVEVVEAGECVIELYSNGGRSNVLKRWRHVPGSDGAAIERYDVSSMSSGVYWLVLRTPTQTATQQFLIVQ